MAPIVLVVCLAAGRGGGEALRRAHKSGMVDSARVHGCDFANGWVYVDGRCQRAQDSGAPPELDRARGFSFGVATSAYQIEGGAALGGRGPSIWDTFSHTPGATANGETGDVAVDHYHRWEEDLALVKALGVDTYRMSIAWPRVMPDGVTLNPEGVAFYHQLFDRLVADGIAPMVTLYHWDLPQALEDRGGWRNKTMIVPAFAAYAKAMFRAFGGKVKMWATFNEPATFVFIASDLGIGAPGRCSHRERCAEGDSLTEPLLIAHSVLVAHAHAVRELRALDAPGGACERCRVGMVNCIKYTLPMDEAAAADWQAAQWRMESELGIWTDPLFFGDYPAAVVAASGARLPPLSAAERALLAGSADYLGLNLYTAQFASARFAAPNAADAGVMAQSAAEVDGEQGDLISQTRGDALEPVGIPGPTGWLYAAPGAMRNTLNWVADRYGRALELIVTEAGCAGPIESDAGVPVAKALDDQYRVAFLHEYLRSALQARVVDGLNVSGFVVWSLLDNFEWNEGYGRRFGLVRVDYERNLTRTPKASYRWLQRAIADVRARWEVEAQPDMPTLAATAVPRGAADGGLRALGGAVGTLAAGLALAAALALALAARRAGAGAGAQPLEPDGGARVRLLDAQQRHAGRGDEKAGAGSGRGFVVRVASTAPRPPPR